MKGGVKGPNNRSTRMWPSVRDAQCTQGKPPRNCPEKDILVEGGVRAINLHLGGRQNHVLWLVYLVYSAKRLLLRAFWAHPVRLLCTYYVGKLKAGSTEAVSSQ